MADDQYRRLSCADCASPFSDLIGRRGPPRVRCFACSPAQLGIFKPSTAVREKRLCANADCAKEFTTRTAAQRACSTQCRSRINNVRKQIAARDRSPRACRWCKSVFQPEYGNLRRVYCTEACRLKTQNSARGGSTHRRRATARGVEYRPIDRLQVFARDRWRCQLCGVQTPRKYSGQTRGDAPELDHIVPFAAGGAHVLENVQCACRSCNLRKRARPMGQLHLALT